MARSAKTTHSCHSRERGNPDSEFLEVPFSKQGAALFFVGAVAIIPLIFTRATLDPGFTVRATLLAVLTIATLVAIRRKPLRLSVPLLAWVAYAAFNVLSISVAVNSGEAIYGASMSLLYGAFFFAALQIVTLETIPSLLRMMAILSLLLSVICVMQYFYIGFRWIPGRSDADPYATMTTKNMMSSFLFLTLPATLYLALATRGFWKTLASAGWACGIFILILAQTRAVWLGTLAAAILCCGLFLSHPHKRTLWTAFRGRMILPATSVGASVLILFVFNLIPGHGTTEQSGGTRVASILHYSSDTSATMRLAVWKNSLTMAREHPILGVGSENWKIVLPSYGLDEYPAYIQDGSKQWTHAHNDFIEVLCETGPAGALAYIAVFLTGIFLAVRTARRTRNTDEILLAILIAGFIAGYAIISCFDFPKDRVEHTMFFILLPVIGGSMSRDIAGSDATRSERHTFIHFLRRGSVTVGVIAASAALYLSAQHFIAETHERAYLAARVEHEWNRVNEECHKTYNAKLLSLDELSTPIMYYRAEAKFMQNDFAGALSDNQEALLAYPHHLFTLNNIGSCYVKLGNFPQAEVFYRKALAISPNFEESLLNFAAVKFNQKQYAEAATLVSRCDTTKPDSRAQSMSRVIRSSVH